MIEFEAIYAHYFEGVYRYVFSLCKNQSVAEDVTQDAFYKAMSHIDKFDGQCKLYTWLCQIAKNTYFTYAKKQNKYTAETEIESIESTESSFEEKLLKKESAWEIHKLIHQLNEPYKEVLSLRVFGELSFSQIGELFGKTDSWARLIFYRAKKELRRESDENDM